MLGVEVVLPDGNAINALRRLRKDNTGYALRHLLVDAEGTLGIITAASLRLFPAAHTTAVAFCAVADEKAALNRFRRFRAYDETAIRSFAYMSGQSLALVTVHIENVTQPPTPPPRHAVLVELASSRRDANLEGLMEDLLEEALSSGEVEDAVIAQSESHRAALWELREKTPERRGAQAPASGTMFRFLSSKCRSSSAEPPMRFANSFPARVQHRLAIWATATFI